AVGAAYWLTSTPQLRARYEVTIYQHGWRLGGKGASGRNPLVHERIEEHGVHMFLGFYENAFRTMRGVFDEWQRPSNHPWKRIEDAFIPQRLITLQEDLPGRGRVVWNIEAPWLPGTPGYDDGLGVDGEFLQRIEGFFRWIDTGLRNHSGAHGVLSPVLDVIEQVLKQLRVPGFLTGGFGVLIALLLGAIKTAAFILKKQLVDDDFLRRLLYLGEIGLSALHAWVTEVLPHEQPGKDAFSRLNDRELRQVLVDNGCAVEVANWAPIKALYDLGFAYKKGDASSIDNGAIAGGVGLKILLRIALAYKDAPLFRMASGMGDTVFTPLYEVLRQRGVRFEFFHRLTNVGVDAGATTLTHLDFDVQAAAVVAGHRYRPLVSVKNLGCWPSQPLWGQLAPTTPHVDFEDPACDVHVATKQLVRGVDFDVCVLGVSIGALPAACAALTTKPAWQRMFAQVPTVATQAFQAWVNAPVEALGFKGFLDQHHTIMTGGPEPFDSWGDMTEVLKTENWNVFAPTATEQVPPQSVHYFCSPMPEPNVGVPAVKARARTLLDRDVRLVWPNTVDAGGFDWKLLVDDSGGVGPARLDAQYSRANVAGSERYVQSFPGTIAARLKADDGPAGSGVKGLFLAGDWIQTGLNAGSAEAAIEGGMLASRAICGVPANIADCEV
ncbi:MAG TPA: hypothetical protein VGF99_08105, partial [Myxococcota bacterium]